MACTLRALRGDQTLWEVFSLAWPWVTKQASMLQKTWRHTEARDLPRVTDLGGGRARTQAPPILLPGVTLTLVRKRWDAGDMGVGAQGDPVLWPGLGSEEASPRRSALR